MFEHEYIYRVYETEILVGIGKQLGLSVEKRFCDIIHPQKEDTRTGEEIAAEIIARHGLKAVI